jgi:hypothetical protein
MGEVLWHMNHYDWERRKDLVMGLLVTAFCWTLGGATAVLLVTFLVLGVIDFARRLG